MNFTFRVGDCGRTRNGEDYEVLKVDGESVYIGYKQPITAKLGDTAFYFCADGVFNPLTISGTYDLMPPTHNIDGTQYTYSTVRNIPMPITATRALRAK